MRGDDQQQNHMFSYLSPEMRVRKDHPLRAIRVMVDEVLAQLSRRFDGMKRAARFRSKTKRNPPTSGAWRVGLGALKL